MSVKILAVVALFSVLIASHNAAGKSMTDYIYESAAKIFYSYGIAEQDKGDLNKALAAYNRAIELDQKLAKAHSYRALIKAKKGDIDGALTDLNQAIELDPNSAILYNARGIAKRDKDLDGALADYNHAIEIDTKYANSYASRSFIEWKKGNLDKAFVDCNRAIELDPNNSYAYASRAFLKGQKGDVDGALSDVNSAIIFDPKNVDNYIYQGFLKNKKGDIKGALAGWDYAIEHDSKSASVYNCSAWLLATASDASVRNKAKALEYATKACELTEWKNANAVDTFAAACAEIGDYDQAVKWESKYIELNPSDTNAQSRLALYKNHQPYHETKK